MIIVFGSLSMDISVGLEKLPLPGETVLSSDYEMLSGGKGGNQALAAARMGIRVALIGRVGNDDYGRKLRDALKGNGVMVSGVAYTDELPTGCSVIAHESLGKKQTIVMTGANVQAIHEQVPDEILLERNVLLMQMELPVEQTVTLLERAKARGVTTILNLAPAIKIPKKALGLLDYLIVNSIEARQIAEKLGIGSEENNALKLAQALSVEGQLTCIVTLGRHGAVAFTKEGEAWGTGIMPVDQEQIVDITGAGDAYCGTFAAAIHEGLGMAEGMRRAAVAATLTCMKRGTQTAMPFLDEINEHLEHMPPVEKIES
ncbi:MAG: ribokinase [Pseudobdellovibrionaceae bacterium]